MALSANTVWEVRTTGANTNGGGFVTGASGVDYSQQAAAQYALTNGVTNGTTTIATTSAATDMVGNIVYVTGGTGSVVAAWYQITAASAGVSITVDRSTGLSAGTGVTLNVGGALLTMAQLFTNMSVAGMGAFVKATATYTVGTGLSASAGTSTTVRNSVVGYTTTRGDLGRPTVQATAAITLLANSAAGYSFENFIFDGNSATGTNGINVSAGGCLLSNIQVKNFSGYGITFGVSSAGLADGVEVFGCGSTAAFYITNIGTVLANAYIHDNTTIGVLVDTQTATLINCIVESNSGATIDGVQSSSGNLTMVSCVLYNNGRDGYRNTSTNVPSRPGEVRNCIFYGNTGFGVNLTSGTTTLTMPTWRNNAYGSNTGGARSGFVAESGAVALSGIPFVDGPNANFALNNTAGAGASCRAAGFPGVSQAGTGYIDIGALQHQDSGGSSVVAIDVHNTVILNRFGVAGY